jgi:hypothetical protein
VNVQQRKSALAGRRSIVAGKGLRDALLLGGAGLLVLAVSVGTGLIFHDFYSMPGDTCSTLRINDSFGKK